jgi:hypothetical protein
MAEVLGTVDGAGAPQLSRGVTAGSTMPSNTRSSGDLSRSSAMGAERQDLMRYGEYFERQVV